MASAAVDQIILDDDEFDWEAAVREIDVACQSALPSTPRSNLDSRFGDASSSPKPPISFPSTEAKKKSGTSQQTTLHRFIRTASERQPEKWVASELNEESASCMEIDAEAAKTWIYPVNVPLREYQLVITKTALFSNTLVALPTGLGKTLIAAVVIYNYFRWFPEGKIVFAAPSRPLVMQQIEACHNIVGIPQEWAIDMTGQISPAKRAHFWITKRVFFVTPQVLEKDIQSGACLVNHLVCLVIDEAHRALGNYSYCVAVRELMAVPVQLRILALTATPGSKQPTIQRIIDNLHISTLEYRNESDNDVSPYVHDRQIELIKVEMGQDAVQIDNMILEVIRPFITRLSSMGLLQNRDYRTLSPCDLLNSRDTFRQSPPFDLPQIKYHEAEGYFGVLITLYHIRKLLSSHGIRPAYEMLEEKLRQGNFARFMSKNEGICKAKLIMQKNLSHGAPSPKLSKMLEVLLDHFRTKDPENSRVIIFSNFRGSVRDIMEALANIGDAVRATQFVGQSSGKTLKGQSQKVQQDVLEKFRAGKYNVIVATSIGEEGLDIMEVDLVICFDANISPLRMIQRMGRTGRKHDGRVVVLACEGSELKGYMRKQANSKAVKKHMRNGGINSFNFHSSPRMIPHIYRPEVCFSELSIEKFVRACKKVRDDDAFRTPQFKEKLTLSETKLIGKYFGPCGEDAWRPSLIAFPHFQTFPSQVHKVMHSNRTGILIDKMQYLQGLYFSADFKASLVEEKARTGKCSEVDNSEECNEIGKGLPIVDNDLSAEPEVSSFLKPEPNHSAHACSEKPPVHSYLFGSDFVSVDTFGMVHIVSVPVLPLIKELSQSSRKKQLNFFEKDSFTVGLLADCEITKQIETSDGLMISETRCSGNEILPRLGLYDLDLQEEKTINEVESLHQHPNSENIMLSGENAAESCNGLEMKEPSVLAVENSDQDLDTELSPRLTNLVNCGVVPESPINDGGTSKEKFRNNLASDVVSSVQMGPDLLLQSPAPSIRGLLNMEHDVCGRHSFASPADGDFQTPTLTKINRRGGFASISPNMEETPTSLAAIAKSSCSNDSYLITGNRSEDTKHRPKLKRLRKIGDCQKNKNMENMRKNSTPPVANRVRSFSRASHFPNSNHRVKMKPAADDVRAFIMEEAEVSGEEGTTSDDEEDDQVDNSLDSFIDDRMTATTSSTQADTGRVDMMAIYRRSLLSQSPVLRLPEYSPAASISISVASTSVNRSGSSINTLNSPQTIHDEPRQQIAEINADSRERNCSSKVGVATAVGHVTRNEKGTESRKRKLSFTGLESIRRVNMDEELSPRTEMKQRGSANFFHSTGDMLFDDSFYQDLDLDAVEAEATLLFRQKSESCIEKEIAGAGRQKVNSASSPSFDLGIL